MTLRVHHYHPCGTRNTGDELVVRALRQSLTQRLGPCEFTSFHGTARGSTQGTPVGLCARNIELNNREADLVLVGGSNMLEPRKIRQASDCNIPLQIELEALKALKTPVILAGMGTGSDFGRRIFRYSPYASAALHTLFAKALAHSVRDITTARELQRIGIQTQCTGCPVTFYTDQPVRPQNDSAPLFVSFPPARIRKRWFGSAFLSLAGKYLHWLKDQGVPFVTTLHEPADLELARELTPPGIEVFHTEDVDELLARFKTARGVIGFRLHAGLLAMGLGKPIIPVGVDWRGLAFIETAQFQDISIRPFRLGQLAKLKQLTLRLLQGDAALLHRLDSFKAALRARHEAFLDDAARKFKQLAPAG